ncbi:MAG: hypothetical protein N3A72_03810 [bacterium]|nr:hypothetical protein [bacterium]
MANKSDTTNNTNTQQPQQPRARGGFSATAFIKKQLQGKNATERVREVTEVVAYPITPPSGTSEPVAGEKTPQGDIAGFIQRSLKVAEEHLANGAVWEAVGVYHAILALQPENIEVRNQLIDILLNNNAKSEAIKELINLAEAYQKKEEINSVTQTYQRILELDPDNATAKTALGIVTEVITPEITPPMQVEPQSETAPEAISAVSESVSEPVPAEQVLAQEPTVLSESEEKIAGQPLEPVDQIESAQPPTEPISEPTISEPQPVSQPIASEPPVEPIPESTNGKLEYYRKILDTNPRDIPARLGYINAYLEVGLEFELIPDYLSLAESYLETGDLDNAEKTYRHIIELEPGHPLAMQGLDGIARLRKSKSVSQPSQLEGGIPAKSPEEKLIENYQRILQLNPLNAEIAHRLVELYKKRNEPKLAAMELTKLADAYMQRSMYPPAIKTYQEILELEPHNPEVQKKLEKAQELQQSMNAIESAIKSYKSGLDYGPIKRTP